MKIELIPAPARDIDLIDIYLTVREADLLSQALRRWEADAQAGKLDVGWHPHIRQLDERRGHGRTPAAPRA
jgi:hypothetical protein